jgi:hypothetical protein
MSNAVVGDNLNDPFTPFPIGAFAVGKLMMECSVDPLPDNDVGVTAAAPSKNIKIPTNTNVSMRAVVRNNGLAAQPAGLEVRYSVNGGPVMGPVMTTTSVNSLDTTSVLFDGPNALNFPSAGTYSVKIYTSMPGDAILGNDSFVVVYTAEPVATLPYRIGDNILGSWSVENSNASSPLWNQTCAVQPNEAVSCSVLFADNISTAVGNTGTVISPTFSFAGATNPVLHFSIAHGPNNALPNLDDTLEVLVSTDGGYTYTSVYMRSSYSSPSLGTDPEFTGVYQPSGDTSWRQETVNLSAFAGQPLVLIVFHWQMPQILMYNQSLHHPPILAEVYMPSIALQAHPQEK